MSYEFAGDYKTRNQSATHILTFTITASFESVPERRREWLLCMFNHFAIRTRSNEFYKVWTGNNHPEEFHSGSFLKVKMDSIHENPVRAGLVARSDDSIYSSAVNDSGKKGLIEFDKLIL